MSTYTIAQFYAAFDEFAADPEKMTDHSFRAVLLKHVPLATGPEAKRYLQAWASDRRAEAEEAKLAVNEAELDMKMCEGFPENTLFRTIVESRAAEGHPRALAWLAKWSDPHTQARQALFEAAVEAHPAWHREGENHFVQDPNIDGPEDDIALVDWFQRTYPREAAAIEARFY